MYKALIIDDEKPVRQGIIALGHWDEYGITQIFEAMEGEAGLEILRTQQPEIALVDMKMPKMDGAGFLEIARREFPQVKYIVISGYDDFEYAKQAIKAKVLDYLLKPVVESELNETLALAITELAGEKGREENGRSFTEFKKGLMTSDKRSLTEIKDYIDRHFEQDIRLSFFAERYYLSKEYLSKLFREEFGFTIYEYVLKVRMEKAKELLSDPAVKVLTVSAYVGYRDNNYFSRAFKTYYGVSPTEFREGILDQRK